MKHLARLFCLLLPAVFAVGLRASETIVVASSFPKEVLAAYKKAFDERNPAYRVEFVNFPGSNIIPFLKGRAAGSRPDVFWSSSTDNFRALRRHGLLQTIGTRGNPLIPATLGKLRIDDPENFYKGQALSGYGIMWNTRYLAGRAISPPATWSDLVRPEYFGHIVMSSPSRSGTTHLIVESILQGAGWDEGWSLILQIAGNSATISDRSFGVPSGVMRGRFGIGLVVDFLALSAKYSGFPVDFAYAWPSAITPASIALIAGARNPQGGLKFIDFTLSSEGQHLLLRPEISRLPVLPEVYENAGLPADYPNLIATIGTHPPSYDGDVSEARYLMVGAIFDQFVTFRHGELVAATRAIHAAERLLRQAPDAEATALIDQARRLLYAPQVSQHDELITGQHLQTRAHIAQIAARESAWARQASVNYVAARRLAEQALATVQ